MGCVASAPQVDDDRLHHPSPKGAGTQQLRQTGSSPEGDGAGEAGGAVTRGGGKGVERAVADSSRKALKATLSGRHRDFVLDSAGKKVSIDALKGAPVGILFTAQTIAEGRTFQRLLLEVYNELRSSGRPFEVVLVSNDETEELWKSAIADTNWVTIPFQDKATVDSIGTRFEVQELPTFIILDREGKFVTNQGINVIKRLGAAAWPFNAESIKAAEAGASGH